MQNRNQNNNLSVEEAYMVITNQDNLDVFNVTPNKVFMPAASKIGEVSNIPFADQIGHAVKRNTLIGTLPEAIKKHETLSSFKPQEGYDVVSDLKERNQLGMYDYVSESESPEETSFIIERVTKMNKEDAFYQSGKNYGIANIAGMLLDPLNLAPIASPVAKGRSIESFFQNMLFNSYIYGTEAAIDNYADERITFNQSLAQAAGTTFFVSIIGTMLSPKAKTIQDSVNAKFKDEIISEPVDEYFGPLTAGSAQTKDSTIAKPLEGDEKLVPTGIGIEKVKITPKLRAFNSDVEYYSNLMSRLVSTSGMIKKKFERGIANDIPVEHEISITYNKPMFDTLNQVKKSYLKYRNRIASDDVIKNEFSTIGIGIKDFASQKIMRKPKKFLSYREFDEEVTRARRRGEHEIPEVMEAAAHYEKVYNEIGQEAFELDLFTKHFEDSIARLEAKIEELETKIKLEQDKTKVKRLKLRRRKARAKIEEYRIKINDIKKRGPTHSGTALYVPRIWKIDQLIKREKEFIARLGYVIFNNDKEIGLAKALEEAQEIHAKLINEYSPYMKIDDADVKDTLIKESGVFRERLLDIKDEMFEDFLENSSEALFRFYVKTTGTDITLKKRFGSIEMKEQIEELKDAFDEKIKAAKTYKEKEKLRKERDQAVEDIRAVRDRIRGTYGMPDDPYKPISRFIRAAKMMNVLTMLGGVTISSIPDIGRVIMTEGFNDTFNYGFRALVSKNREIIKKMNRKELNMASEALDIILGTRALQFMDAGDMFGKRFMFERALHNSQGAFFILNGLHIWNTAMKEFAGMIISAKMIDAMMRFEKDAIKKSEITRLARSGIDKITAKEIVKMVRKHGEKVDIGNGDYMWFPNTEKWEDPFLAKAYRNALVDNVDRTIVTPDSGDRALWTSREVGSMIAQFKSFGQAATTRILISGLQEKQAAFYYGGAMLIGLGMIVNEIKRQQYGIDKKESLKAKIAAGIDRSGIAGIFTDISNAAEVLTDNSIGLNRLIGETNPWTPSTRNKMGVLFGPTGSQVQNSIEILRDVSKGKFNKNTRKKVKRLIPLQNHPLFDPVYDSVLNVK